jgi:hypothetical protein
MPDTLSLDRRPDPEQINLVGQLGVVDQREATGVPAHRCPAGFCAAADRPKGWKLWADAWITLQTLLMHSIIGIGLFTAIKIMQMLVHLYWPGDELVWFKGSAYPLRVDWIFDLADVALISSYLACSGWIFIAGLIGRSPR